MREEDFKRFLESATQITSKDKAVKSRISRAYAAEEVLNGTSLDYIVADDERMYEALSCIHDSPKERNGNIQNALRWYYLFANGKRFPTLSFYRRFERE